MGLDSVELVMEWEKYFQIEIPDKDAANMSTVEDAVEYISSQVRYSKQHTDIKEKILIEFRNAVVKLGISFSITPLDSVFQLIPLKDVETWKAISLETKLDMPEPILTGFFGNLIERIFPQKDHLGLTTLERFIDLLAAVNYEKIIDRNQIQNKYEIMVAVVGITIEKIGVSPFEVYLNSSFTKDLGID
ncbi:acyl carrier protein [Pedobacter sp. B4-66]|uniref:acyl carrier protein n=1 Tax=Pedobacter sp. B4-66 TaxID=2817280 RepID=UPI001BDB20ED|nr:acyl carrier protein [Pedobacter sp. B4-66]